MSESKLIKGTKSFLEPLQEFEKKQNQLVKENPFIEITNTETFESAKKSRTALVKGRTELQKQQKTINDSVNSIKTAVKTETERLIGITKPAEELQQNEVKRYEAIQEEKRLERERIAEEKKQAVMEAIDDVFSGWIKDVNQLVFEKIEEFQKDFEEYFNKIDTSDYEDLEIYFNGRYAQLITQFNQKCIELKKDQELLVSQSENRFQQFKTKWMERFMNANIDNISQLNIDFDTEVPEIDPDTFFSFKDEFIQQSKDFRNKLVDITNTCKLQQEKADEEKRISEIKTNISNLFNIQKEVVENLKFENIIKVANELSQSHDEIKEEYYEEFKEIIDLNISNIEKLYSEKTTELSEKQKELELAEEKRIAKEKEDEKKELALKKKNDAAEKKRQKELKPIKKSAINEINYFTPMEEFNCENTDVAKVVGEFHSELKCLQEKYIKKINTI